MPTAKPVITWKTKDGQIIPIHKMADSHLVNTLLFLERQAEYKRDLLINFYMTCAPPTADLASECFDREFDQLLDSDSYELFLEDQVQYQAMWEEMTKRNLLELYEVRRAYHDNRRV